ncbi:MAG: septum formation initiator family protein [Anaerolineaceae bacterium]|nr:septum formation initiator family protein [Anaerolineaceae bacterium]
MKKANNDLWLKVKTWLQREAGIKDARLLLGVVLGMVIVLLMTTLNARLSALNRLSDRRDELTSEVVSLQKTQQALETQVVYASSDAAVAEWARSEGHMKQEGDHVVIPIPVEGAAPAVVATPIPTPLSPEAWEVWYALFFGE